jgi:hypothetical protein
MKRRLIIDSNGKTLKRHGGVSWVNDLTSSCATETIVADLEYFKSILTNKSKYGAL